MDVRRDASLRARLENAFWERHANPKSGWSRVLLGALVPIAVYRRDWRLLGLVVIGLAGTPVVFSPPAVEIESWMTRGVRAERSWLEAGCGAFGLGWPNILNTLNAPLYGYAMYAAYRRTPGRAGIAYVLSMLCKFAWIEAIARRYDRSSDA
ncbi:DUF6653 family protein [Natronococcus wangiae]|uniref:DUF6653 family protein n=1 Tax=Natronococcus wangiae TaxID=3068275 RepID=UPI0027401AB7|nr:DUF6653 family protein [Natronococcus sp. AD5]